MRKPGKLSASQKRETQRLIEQALHALSIGKHNVCEHLCLKAEALHPGHPDALNLRGICAAQSGRTKEAASLFEEAIALNPGRSEFHINLGGVHLTEGRPAKAVYSYEQALKLDARSLAAQSGYGTALYASGRQAESIEILEKVQKRCPNDIDVCLKLYRAYYRSKRVDEAHTLLLHILDLDPNNADLRCELGELALEKGSKEEAEKEIRAALTINPDNADAYTRLMLFKKPNSESDPDFIAMHGAYSRSTPGSTDRMLLSFSMGTAAEKMKQYDRAFEYFEEGNTIRHQSSSYNPELELSHMKAIADTYSKTVCSMESSLDDATPIFIVGMPRCGSTLTEQILEAHPDVTSKGEWGEFERGLIEFGSQDTPLTLEQITAFSPGQWQELGNIFLQRLKADLPESLRIIDKSLSNIRMVGAIHCSLPKAKIIHVRRHPLDTCLSIYKNNLTGKLFDFGHDLEELAHYYCAYLELMAHWRSVLPADAMYEIDYENLVDNQEGETRKLLEYCELPWNNQCLQFNKAKTIVRTASIAQVRKPIYKSSMATWQRYEKQLQPLIEILGPEYSTDYQPGRF